MLQFLLFILLFNQGYPQNQPVHDEWKYCQLFFENKLTKTSFETCDVCFMPLTYYKSIGRSLTKSQYRPKSKQIITGATIGKNRHFCSRDETSIYDPEFFLIDLNEINEVEMIERVEQYNCKKQPPGGLVLLLEGEQVLLPRTESHNSKVTKKLVQMNLTFPVYIFRVQLFANDVRMELAKFIGNSDESAHKANPNVTLTASYEDDSELFENWMHMIALCNLIIIQTSTTLIAYHTGRKDFKILYFIQGKLKLPSHEHSGSSDCPMTIYVAKCGLWAVLLLLILFAILFIVTGFGRDFMYYVFYILFLGCLAFSTLLLWIRVINHCRILRCNTAKWKKLITVLVPGLSLGALFGTMHVLMHGQDYYIPFLDLFNCIIIIAFLLHFEIMSFWSMVLYGLGMLTLEFILGFVNVSTGLDCPKKASLQRSLFKFAFRPPLISGPGVKIDTVNENSYQLLNHAPLEPQNPFFLVIFHLHTFKLICQHPLKFSTSQWSIYVPSVLALYLCRFNEQKSLNPSKLYVSLTLTIMVLGTVVDFIIEAGLFGKSCGLIFSVPLIITYAVVSAALRKELRFLVFAKNNSEYLDPASRTSGTQGLRSHVMPYYDPQSSSFGHARGLVPVRSDDVTNQRGRSYSRSKRKRRRRRPKSVPIHCSYRPGVAAADDTADITLDVIRRRTEQRPFCLSEFSITSLSRCLDMTYLTYY